MKRIFFISMFVIASMMMFSCTDDTAETTPNNVKVKVVAEVPGDPINPIPPIKP